jgi:hypothetical protein
MRVSGVHTATDLTQSDGTRLVSVRLLDTACGRRGFACGPGRLLEESSRRMVSHTLKPIVFSEPFHRYSCVQFLLTVSYCFNVA